MNKENKIQPKMEYTALSMKEIMLHATARMNLKDNRLTKINQSQKFYA